jgi:hypothetical protein
MGKIGKKWGAIFTCVLVLEMPPQIVEENINWVTNMPSNSTKTWRKSLWRPGGREIEGV